MSKLTASEMQYIEEVTWSRAIVAMRRHNEREKKIKEIIKELSGDESSQTAYADYYASPFYEIACEEYERRYPEEATRLERELKEATDAVNEKYRGSPTTTRNEK